MIPNMATTTSSWTLAALVFLGIIGQVALIWWLHGRAAKRISDAKRQARKEQATMIEKEFDKMKGGK